MGLDGNCRLGSVQKGVIKDDANRTTLDRVMFSLCSVGNPNPITQPSSIGHERGRHFAECPAAFHMAGGRDALVDIPIHPAGSVDLHVTASFDLSRPPPTCSY